MNTKEAITKLLASGYTDGPVRKDRHSLLDGIVSKVPLKEILSLKNNLIGDSFKQIMKDKDMVNCIEEFFKYDLNVAETSRNSYLHRNTLLYRLDKIHNMTGLNLKNFEDAVAFKILMQIYRLTT